MLATTAFADPIHTAAWDGDLAGVQAELDKGVDVNEADINFYNLAPLHYAAIHGQKEIAELLIAAGADVSANTTTGGTPLHLAALFGRKEVVELLIANGAAVNVKGGNLGGMPLHHAAFEGHKEIVELLLAKSADVNAKG